MGRKELVREGVGWIHLARQNVQYGPPVNLWYRRANTLAGIKQQTPKGLCRIKAILPKTPKQSTCNTKQINIESTSCK